MSSRLTEKGYTEKEGGTIFFLSLGSGGKIRVGQVTENKQLVQV